MRLPPPGMGMQRQCEFSEFTYGYVFTEECTRNAPIRVAPVFPTLRQEKQAGYDVKIAGFGFVQFKRPEVLVGNRARETAHGLKPTIYRMHLTNHQHARLLALAARGIRGARVYYACPCFSTVAVLNTRYRRSRVLSSSLLVEARHIGALSATERHFVSFNRSSLAANRAYRFSEEPFTVATNSQAEFESWVSEVADEEPLTDDDLGVIEQTLRDVLGDQTLPDVRPVSEASQRDARLVTLARLSRIGFDAELLLVVKGR